MNDCEKWLKDPSKNPTTNRAIKVGGPVYKKLEKECGSPPPSSSFKKTGPSQPSPKVGPKKSEPCEKWLKDPSKNPTTNIRKRGT